VTKIKSKILAEPRAKRGARQQLTSQNLTSCEMWNILNYVRTFF